MRGKLLSLAVLSLACGADLPEGRFLCESAENCPNNWVCIDARCYSSPFVPRRDASRTDAGIDAPEDVGVDVRRDAAFVPENTVALCSDERDNDGDGRVDCADDDCCRVRFEECDACRMRCPDFSAREEVVVTESRIAEDTTWDCFHDYVLDALVVVDEATLTIEAGTRIRARSFSGLIVTRGARLTAVGQATRPIVFTSASEDPEPGDWFGVYLAGNAITSRGPDQRPDGTGDEFLFGGGDDRHNCGRLSFVRVEFAGGDSGPDGLDLGALMLMGCGDETSVDHVQVHRSKDDGLAIFGGTVNVREVLVTHAADDGLDWERGWRGVGERIAIWQDPGGGNAAIEGSNNDPSGIRDAEPRSNPELWYVTTFGGRVSIRLADGTFAALRNSVLHSGRERCVELAAELEDSVMAGDIAVTNSIVHGCPEPYAPAGVAAAFSAPAAANESEDPGIDGIDDAESPRWLPDVSVTRSVPQAAAPTPQLSVGAFDEDNWTAGWVAYP
ncbi:MAG: hypothetical protein AAGE52_00610 [Myxococcota bacterium]